jgi:AcrR family transcriptional regulator
MGPRGLQRREQLLQAALELFAENGYEGTCTRHVAERTGVTEAVLFKHFPTKQDLFQAVLQRFGPEQVIRLPQEELSSLPFAEALERQVRAFLDASWEHRCLLHTLFHTARREPNAAEELRRQYEEVRAAVRWLLAERARRGEVRSEMTDAAMQIIALSMRAFMMQGRRKTDEEWRADSGLFVQNLVAVVTHGVAILP